MLRPRPWFIVLIGIIALMLLALAGFVRPVRETIRAVLLPVVRFTAAVGSGVGRSLRLDADSRAANERVRELEARMRTMTVDYVRLRGLEEENRSLRAQAKFIAETGFRSLGARVISRVIADQTAAVTIDRGARDGVEVGQAVVTDEGLLVGKVTSLGERTAVVMLVSDVRSRVAASLAGSERLAGVLEGQGSGAARFTLIPQAVPVKRDDVVVTAGTEEKIPSNLVLGLVNDVQSQPTDPFKTASVEPLAPLDRLELVSIIIPRANTEVR
ncbi:MAG TPA: rod shape-determining protein MreC [Candidatus Methylomirabilis sp.]|nr:rod shape-determining protein MreC [Candidatus Methylomirabilis sp.]